ncbi:MAG: restriction endonuclease subunit S [Candidatus Cloacimonetes bacterium]|nr:restriction endonuclease subunit S [Candidatus Cloacimonadota bacterium]
MTDSKHSQLCTINSPLKKGYKHSEVGLIPEDWETPKMGEFVEFKNGLNKAKEFFGHGTPIVNYMDVFDHSGLHESDVAGTVAVNRDEIHAYSAKKGDVFFTRTSETVDEIGCTTVLLDEIKDAVFSGFVLRARSTHKTLSLLFKKYCFSSSVVRKQIMSTSSYTTRALTNGRSLSQVYLPCPVCLKEQQAIAEALSDVDALIGSLEKLVAKKRAIKTGVMQQLLTGKKRLPGFEGEWETKRLGDIIDKFIGGGTPSRSDPRYWGNEIPWVTVKDFATFNPRQSQESITKEGLVNSASHLIKKSTLITSTRRALGKAVIYEVDVAINQDLKALYPKTCVATKYLYYWFQYKADFIDDLGSGSTVKGISLPDLKKVEFLLPFLSEQQAIATVLSDMDAEIQALEKRLDKAKAIKQGMMQELLTGKTRLV